MFRWYQNSARCYVYLSDVLIGDYVSNQSSQSSWESPFRASRWFTRGWTLQKLIGPTSVEFYSREGKRLGDKKSLERQVHEITGIPVPALRGNPLSGFSTDERLLWAQNRNTTRSEDWAYSLLGIFDVVIPLLYGEGRDKAVMRLKREIDEATNGPTRLKGAASSVVDFRDGTEGPTAQEVQTHDSMQSWVRSFQSGSATGFSNIKQLGNKKGPVRNPSDELLRLRLPRNRMVFARQQPVPPDLRQFVRQSIGSDHAHLIMHGLGTSAGETRENMFPRSATINAILEYLEQEGFGPICAFQVQTDRGSYVVERSVPKSAITAVEVTDGPSCYDIQMATRSILTNDWLTSTIQDSLAKRRLQSLLIRTIVK
ncbi:hypothetical protein GJ744_010378 [Endocarpon pusillum]|uniref:Uncharacterized protein n=1 Tax=Endocarpon pusillum TaxID=364733 RepID=A0A8H7E2Y2_9EURO|nr:hypothetical protein GJ744_010378 [Endocarpon pusillum]